MKTDSRDHDHPLKLIFSDPMMMTDLIKGFVPEAWIQDLDFSSLQKFNVAHVTDDLRSRENDCIWRLNFRQKPFFIICLTEFQSKVQHFMAVRILTYVGLIYQDLIRSRKLKKKDKLPPVFSLVYYTGEKKWDAPLDLRSHFSLAIPEGLMRYQPQIEYSLMNVNEISIADSPHLRENLVLPLVELEQVDDLTLVKALVEKMAKMFKGEHFNDLRSHLLSYIKKAAKLHEKFPEVDLHDLHEVSVMLSARLDRRDEKLKQESRQEGRHEERISIARMLIIAKHGENAGKVMQNLEKLSDQELKTFIANMIHEKQEEIILD